jgi:hypothetical protein
MRSLCSPSVTRFGVIYRVLSLRFDSTEDYRTAQPNVRFRGILEIQKLSWLTSSAYFLIEQELRKRDSPDHSSSLTLAKLYGPNVFGQGLKVRVLIQCNKMPMGVLYYDCTQSAHVIFVRDQRPFLLAPLAPEGLIVCSIVSNPGRPNL